MDFEEQLSIEIIRGGFSVCLLYLTWYGGQRILAQWELRKQNKALDFQIAQRFQELIGEWKAIWRAWKVLKTNAGSRVMETPPTARWELLDRAAKAEGSVEAIILRLAVERDLYDHERERLGLFRQYYQQLRQGIRDDRTIDWQRHDPEYWLSHELAIYVAEIISREPPQTPLSTTDAIRQLKDILIVNEPSWNATIEELRSTSENRSPQGILNKPLA